MHNKHASKVWMEESVSALEGKLKANNQSINRCKSIQRKHTYEYACHDSCNSAIGKVQRSGAG
jgi:hypothetical protein